MRRFTDFKIKKELLNAIADMGFEQATPIQEAAYSPILAGQDFVELRRRVLEKRWPIYSRSYRA